MASLHFQDWLPAGSVFLEEQELYSSTIKAVRRAYDLLHQSSGANGHARNGMVREEDTLYYLV
jgi:hypothetical protein